LGPFKADRNSVVDLEIKVGAVAGLGPNIEGISRLDPEAATISVEFEWLVYLSHCER
jgi:hypothetical protein